MALQNFRHFKTKLNSQLKHSAGAQDALCWHKVIISLPQCLLTTLTQISFGCALLELSPSSWVRILRTFHKNNPRSLEHNNSFFDIFFCLILFFFLCTYLTHIARRIPSSCTFWITQPGQLSSVPHFWSWGGLIILLSPNTGMFHGSHSSWNRWGTQQPRQLVPQE